MELGEIMSSNEQDSQSVDMVRVDIEVLDGDEVLSSHISKGSVGDQIFSYVDGADTGAYINF